MHVVLKYALRWILELIIIFITYLDKEHNICYFFTLLFSCFLISLLLVSVILTQTVWIASILLKTVGHIISVVPFGKVGPKAIFWVLSAYIAWLLFHHFMDLPLMCSFFYVSSCPQWIFSISFVWYLKPNWLACIQVVNMTSQSAISFLFLKGAYCKIWTHLVLRK